jgi:MOSC domain-containing protein YiiM
MIDDFRMNIYALKGHQVKCTRLESPYEYQTERAKKYLEIGTIYTVEQTEVHSSSTEVYLQEIPEIAFNSTLFEDVKKQSEKDDQKHPDYWKYHDKTPLMKIVSTNIGERKEIDWKGKKVTTGIFKYAVDQPIFLDVETVKEDTICDRKHHGGVDQAVYGYSLQHYEYWKKLYPELDFEYGIFGENLTIDNLEETQLHVGDQFVVGECLLEVTKPRQPCMKLGVRFNDMRVVKQFWNTTMSGVYFKVLITGKVKAGDYFREIKKCPENPTIAEVYEDKKNGK